MSRVLLRRGSTLLISALIVFCLVFPGVIVKRRIDRELRQETGRILDLGAKIAENAGNMLYLREMSVRGMQLMGESFLENPVFDSGNDPLSGLVPLNEGEAYTLLLPPGPDSRHFGNITGYGALPPLSGPEADEMRMALTLTPLFRILIEVSDTTPWVYYTSLAGFMYLFPRAEPEQFLMSPEVLDLEFVRNARQDRNPSRSVFWTSIYEDAAGKGLMVTVSAPIYHENILKGSISCDISLGELNWLLNLVSVPYSTVQLIDTAGRNVLSGSPVVPYSPWPVEPGMIIQENGDWKAVFPLQAGGGWSIGILTDGSAVRKAVLVSNLPLLFLVFAFMGIILLIAALTRSLRRVQKLSTTDHLTGLLNRRVFEVQGLAAYARAQRGSSGVGFGIFDIDDFKKYNDSMGHGAGDRALKAVARTAGESLQRTNDRVFRIGGEEFAVLVDAENETQMVSAMEKVVRAVAALAIPHPRGTHGVVTVSMGGVLVRQGTYSDPEEAYRAADTALYRAKSAGKNRAVLHEGGSIRETESGGTVEV